MKTKCHINQNVVALADALDDIQRNLMMDEEVLRYFVVVVVGIL